MSKTRVMITGLGMVTPVGLSVAESWQNIRDGKSGIGPITKFNPERVSSKIAGEVKGFEACAAQYLGPKDPKRMALFTQYAVVAAKQAWADAAFATEPNMERVAVLFGNGIGGKDVDDEGYEILFNRGPARLTPMIIPRLIPNECAGNVSIALGAKGPAQVIVTACASSTDALGNALDMIRAGRADVVIAGGTEGTVQEYCVGGFCSMHALSTHYNDTPEKACRPFDATRDGFIMGEGAAVLILESEEHAKARGAKVYAELAGYGASADAYHLTAPDPEATGAMRAISLALADADVTDLTTVDYINAHGTSTGLNDPMETKAIKGVFGDQAYALKVSSTKSMTGHLLGAAGALEAAICALSIRDGFYPPTINYTTPDPACDLNYVPNTGVAGPIRTAISTSLGFGGHNGVLVFKAV